MEYTEALSSIVMIGDGFSPSLFRAEKHVDLLGQPDHDTMVITPVISQQSFSGSGYRVLIVPDRIDLSFTKSDLLPDGLEILAKSIAETLERIEVPTCKGIGINLNVTIPQQEIGISGTEFCRKLLDLPDVEQRLGSDRFVASLAKLVFEKGAVRFTAEIEPHFASHGANLHLKINAHQDTIETGALMTALARYQEIKEYVVTLPGRIVQR